MKRHHIHHRLVISILVSIQMEMNVELILGPTLATSRPQQVSGRPIDFTCCPRWFVSATHRLSNEWSEGHKIFIKTADGKLNKWLVCFCAAMDRLRYTHYRTWFITLTSHSLKKQKVENKMQPRWRDSFTKQITCWHKHQYINMAGNEQRENNEKRGNQSNHPLTPYQLMNNNHPT